MKFVLFVEGYTEKKVIAPFLRKWLDKRLDERVGIKLVRFNGWKELVKDMPGRAVRYLRSPTSDDVIAVIALLDLYGPDFYPRDRSSAEERLDWGKQHLQENARQELGEAELDRFRVFFAVHEVEAWLLSDPNLFPIPVKEALSGKIRHPESVNFAEPPSKLLQRLYKSKRKKSYKKVVDGYSLFGKLDPDTVHSSCPYFREMMDEMLTLAKNAIS